MRQSNVSATGLSWFCPLVFLLLYAKTLSLAKTFVVLLAVPFSGIGAIWLLYVLGYNLSVAVWVG